MTQLEQSIAALCEQHNLLSLGITYQRPDDWDNCWYSVDLQWRDLSEPHQRGGVHESHETIAEALSIALAKMATTRAVTLADEALPSIAA